MKKTTTYADKRNKGDLALYDRWLMLGAVAILAIGLLMVASASIVISDRIYHQPFHYLYRQIVFLSAGMVLILLLLRIDTEYIYRSSPALLILSFMFLLMVFIPGLGRTVNGSTRWINLVFFRFQAAELVKLFLVIFIASYIKRHYDNLEKDFSTFVRPLILLAVAGGLLILQPDFGTATVVMATGLGMLFLARVRLWQFALLLGLVLLALVVLSVSAPYRLQRLTTFLNPWATQFDGGYQLTQSLIAFGRGGWFGVGLGESVQKLFYLPEAHTDFLFAVIAEELGLIGVLSVIALFTLIIVRGFIIAKAALKEDKLFAGFLAYGLTLWLALQAVINIGVNAGALPTKGLTLPLMSAGGSSLIVSCMLLGLLLRIDHETRLSRFCLHSGASFRGWQ